MSNQSGHADRSATIVGGRGFIGRNLAAVLTARGWECWVPDKHEPTLLERELGHVFYCAGLTADFARRPFDTVEAHASLLNRLLERGRFRSLVYLSSTRLYDSSTEKLAREASVLQLDPGNPRHIYDLSKALGESLCLVSGRGRAKVARLSCVWRDHTDEDGFLPQLLSRAIAAARARTPDSRSAKLEVDSSPYFARDYVHLDDVIEALVRIATSNSTEVIYNVAGGENLTNKTLFDRITELSGCKVVALRNDEPSRPPTPVCIDRMRQLHDWHPASTLAHIETVFKRALAC